jgi:hypothetical protein
MGSSGLGRGMGTATVVILIVSPYFNSEQQVGESGEGVDLLQ